MAYKRISPAPIIEGGTNATSMATTFGTVYYDGTRLVTTATGTAGQILTSNSGGGVAPTYQTAGAAGTNNFFLASNTSEGAQSSAFTAGTAPYSVGVGSTTVEGYVAPANCTLRNLFVRVYAQGVSGNTVIITVYVNGVATGISVTIPAVVGAFPSTFSDTVNTAAVTQGQIVQFLYGGGAGPTADSCSISLQVTI